MNLRCRVALAVLFVGCASGDDPPTDDAPAVVQLEPAEGLPVTPARTAPSGEAELVIQYEGVSQLYQGYFGDDDAGDALSRAASVCVGDTTYLYVSYDEATRVGRLTLRVEPSVAACRPVATAQGWDLGPMVPLSTSLAVYRDTLASRYDLRIASFHVQVATRTERSLCTWRAAGTHPPDGTGFAPCVQHGLERRCGEPVVGQPAQIAFTDADARALRSCVLGG